MSLIAIDEKAARDILSQVGSLPPSIWVILDRDAHQRPILPHRQTIHHNRQHVWQTLALYNISLFITQDPELLVSIPKAWERARVVRPTKKKKLQVLVGNLPVPRCVLYDRRTHATASENLSVSQLFQ